MMVNIELVEIALERVSGGDFERFFQAFYPALAGIDFVPLGGFHDGGADAFQGELLFKGKTHHRPGTFYQATTQEDFRAKIRHTVKRLREFGRDPQTLLYVTSRTVSAVDKEEEHLSGELDVSIKIRDRKWIAGNINHSQQTVVAFETYLKPSLSHLGKLGGATTIGGSANIDKDVLTLWVFLGQEIERRRGNTDLLEAVTDSLILWALEGTDPDKNSFMTRLEIRSKIEAALPSAVHFIRGVFDHRIETMAAKGNPTGREVRRYRRGDKFCLPYETRKIVATENTEDEILKRQVLDVYEERAARIPDAGETVLPNQLAKLVHRALELTFERNGLELVKFLSGGQDESRGLAISDQVDEAIEEAGLTGADTVRAKEVALDILRQAFYSSTEAERVYYGKLSRTYTLMFTLRNEPKIVEYFKSMSSNFVLFVGADIIVRALSERYLADVDQMTVNLLRILREAGATLILTHMTVEEVHSHIKTTDQEFRNLFHNVEPHVGKEFARHSRKILLRAYFYAKSDPLLEARPANWKMFIEQICSYADLYDDTVSRDQVKNYLMEKFGLEYLDETDMEELVDDDEAKNLAGQIESIKSEDVLARNDARHILAVYGKRRALRERYSPSPYGYRTWWLTHETKVRGYTRELVRSHAAEYIIRPEFILNFVALSPTTEAVRKSYGTIFPTLLGIRLSNRMREDIFKDVMRKVNNVCALDEARAKTMIVEMSNKLKGDNYKIYEANFSD